MSADNYVHDHLTNEEYNMASEVWYHAELVLKQSVRGNDGAVPGGLPEGSGGCD